VAALAPRPAPKERVTELAADLLAHFLDRTATLKGKAMVVAMTRATAFVSMTRSEPCQNARDQGRDDRRPRKRPDGVERGRPPHDKDAARGLKKADDRSGRPAEDVIVCDMWLTGTDIPCLHTLYIDKPMRGHNMIQAHFSREPGIPRQAARPRRRLHRDRDDCARRRTAIRKAAAKGSPPLTSRKEARPLFSSSASTDPSSAYGPGRARR